MANGRKQIAFDLDPAALRLYYPQKRWNNAYEEIKKYMKNNGFSWRQGSVYTSLLPISGISASNILHNLVLKNPWLNICMRDCTITNIGREHSQNHLFDKTVRLPSREDGTQENV